MRTIPGGLFIVFSGPEGGGKSTQIRLLAEHLKFAGFSVVATKEPGGDDPVCREIRSMLLTPGRKVLGKTEFFLFCADRCQHLAHEVRPALERGSIVLCDRYVADTYAYQCYARKAIDPESFTFMMGKAIDGMQEPRLTFWFDLPVEIGLARKHEQNEITRFEDEVIEFHRNVAKGFEEYFSNHSESTPVRVQAERPADEVHAIVFEDVRKVILQALHRQHSPA